MSREHNATAAHFDLTAYADRTKIGSTFHKPAPIRSVTYTRPGRIMRALYAILIGINL